MKISFEIDHGGFYGTWKIKKDLRLWQRGCFELTFEFFIVLILLIALGPDIYSMINDVPFAPLFRFIIPRPEDNILIYIKALIEAGLITGLYSRNN